MHGYYLDVLRAMHSANYTPDVIIAPMRGGVDMGVKFSEYLNVPVVAIQWQTRDGGERDSVKIREVLKQYHGGKILVVDDICDSGETLNGINCVVDRYTDIVGPAIVDYAVALYKESSGFEPTWWGRTIMPNDEDIWWVFPWEAWWKQ